MNTPAPPSWAGRFLQWYCHGDLMDEIQGDLHEQFQKNYQNKGVNTAKWKFILDVFRFCRPSSFKKTRFSINTQIISNYLKVAFRVFKKEKGYTFTNVFGLALGITCSLFIYLWVQDELKYNQWPEEVERIHYVHNNVLTNGVMKTDNVTPLPLKAVLDENYPVIDQVAVTSFDQTHIFKNGEKNIQVTGLMASPEFVEIFSIPFIQGTHKPMYDQWETIVISESFAERYFGDDWRTMHIPGKQVVDKNKQVYTVSGVFKNIAHSTLNSSFLTKNTFQQENG